MTKRIWRMRLPSPAMIVALVALGLATSGSATALALVTSADIKNDTIKSVDVHKNALTGADIAEAKLGKVPNAKRVGGLVVRPIRAQQTSSTPERVVLDSGGLRVRMRCDSSSSVTVVASGTGVQMLASTTVVNSSGGGLAEPRQAGNYQGSGGVAGLGTSGIGTATATGPAGLITVFEFAYNEHTNGFGTERDCFLRGVLTTSKP